MSRSARVWLVLALLYALFFGWYTSFEGPLTEDEITHYREALRPLLDADPDSRAAWLRFMETDTGDDFAMLNAIELRETPLSGPGIDPGDDSEEVLARYTRPFMASALLDAAHPLFFGSAAAPALDLWGIEGAAHWSAGGLVRYRSRRDLLEQAVRISQREGPPIHEFKVAAMAKTIAYPIDPFFHVGDPRLLLALLLLVAGLSAQLVLGSAAAGADSP